MKYSYLLLALLITGLALPALAQQDGAPPTPNSSQQVTPMERYVFGLLQKVESEDRTVHQLSPRSFASLPVGITGERGDTAYFLVIDTAWANRRGWFFNAYAAITLPGATRPLIFAGKNIVFTQAGLAQAHLELTVAQTIRFNDSDLVLLAGPANAVEFDCNGFKALDLKGVSWLDEKQPKAAASPRPITRLEVSPNPNEGTFTVTVALAQKQQLVLLMYDALGVEKYRKTWERTDAVTEMVTLNASSSGFYVLRALTDNDSQEVRIVVNK